jgi:hypothetical protein
VCGNGIVEGPYEDCDAPKICDANSGLLAGSPCTAASQCLPGKCIPNTVQCPNAGKCSVNCTCPVVPGCYPYYLSDFGIKIHAIALGQDVVFDLGSGTTSAKTTANLCHTDPKLDKAGRSTVGVLSSSWFSDAITIPTSSSFPLDLTVRLCLDGDLSGTVFTKAINGTSPAASYSGKVCVAGDGSKLAPTVTTCSSNAQCDGPVVTGNGICATRDVDYVSQTDLAGTTFPQEGDGVPDVAGSALGSMGLRADLWSGLYACAGDGINPDCQGCDGNPAPVGRLGVDMSSAGAPIIVLPLTLRGTTGDATNNVVAGPVPPTGLNGTSISGTGHPLAGMSLWLGAADGKLQVSTILGDVDASFVANVGFTPCPNGVCP